VGSDHVLSPIKLLSSVVSLRIMSAYSLLDGPSNVILVILQQKTSYSGKITTESLVVLDIGRGAAAPGGEPLCRPLALSVGSRRLPEVPKGANLSPTSEIMTRRDEHSHR
jgi:hypothetical protein